MNTHEHLFQHQPHQHKTQNINKVHDASLTFGDRISDRVASGMGSWIFIIVQSVILALWIILNSVALIVHWDGYPYILLNLALSFEAAFSAPFIMMSQNRQAAKDRLAAEHDYLINERNEQETREVITHLQEQDKELLAQTKLLTDLQARTLAIVQKLQNKQPEDSDEQHLAYAFYIADFDATDPRLGHPRLVWGELEEPEQAAYLRYARIAMRREDKP